MRSQEEIEERIKELMRLRRDDTLYEHEAVVQQHYDTRIEELLWVLQKDESYLEELEGE